MERLFSECERRWIMVVVMMVMVVMVVMVLGVATCVARQCWFLAKYWPLC